MVEKQQRSTNKFKQQLLANEVFSPQITKFRKKEY